MRIVLKSSTILHFFILVFSEKQLAFKSICTIIVFIASMNLHILYLQVIIKPLC